MNPSIRLRFETMALAHQEEAIGRVRAAIVHVNAAIHDMEVARRHAGQKPAPDQVAPKQVAWGREVSTDLQQKTAELNHEACRLHCLTGGLTVVAAAIAEADATDGDPA
jgi:hypothetical protein